MGIFHKCFGGIATFKNASLKTSSGDFPLNSLSEITQYFWRVIFLKESRKPNIYDRALWVKITTMSNSQMPHLFFLILIEITISRIWGKPNGVAL